MRKVVQFLPYGTRVLAICAVLAGIGVGFLQATFGSAFVCFDSCVTREFMFSYLGPSTGANATALRRARAAGAGGICSLLSRHRAGAACSHADPLPADLGSGRRRRALRPPAARSDHSPCRPGWRPHPGVSEIVSNLVGAGHPACRRRVVRRSGLPAMAPLSDTESIMAHRDSQTTRPQTELVSRNDRNDISRRLLHLISGLCWS